LAAGWRDERVALSRAAIEQTQRNVIEQKNMRQGKSLSSAGQTGVMYRPVCKFGGETE
jgi:hypothetical protein